MKDLRISNLLRSLRYKRHAFDKRDVGAVALAEII